MDAVPLLGALADHEDRVAAVVGDLGSHHAVRELGVGVDQGVIVLGGPERVVPDGEVQVDAALCRVRIGLGIAAVEEAPVVVGPGSARELDPAEVVGELLAARDLHHVELPPVGARFAQPVGEQRAVLRECRHAHAGRAVLGQLVRVEQHLPAGRVLARRVDPVEDVLVLEPVVRPHEPLLAEAEGGALPRVVLEFEEAGPDRLALRKRAEVVEGDLVLGVHPLEDLGGLVVLEPAVGVFDGDAVEFLGDVVLAGVRVVVAAAAGGEGGEQHREQRGPAAGAAVVAGDAVSGIVHGLFTRLVASKGNPARVRSRVPSCRSR